MISYNIPRFGQCIETPNGEGIVNAITPAKNGDYLLTIVNFADKSIEKLYVSEWNEYIEALELFKEIEQLERGDKSESI